jgi:hypothetical protein
VRRPDPFAWIERYDVLLIGVIVAATVCVAAWLGLLA